MRHTGIIIFLFLVTLSCKDSNTDELTNLTEKNKDLQKQIAVLRDSLSNYEEEFLHSQTLIGIADDAVLKVGKENNVVMLFQTYGKKLPEYEIYKVEGKKQIRLGNNNATRFNFSFTPKSMDDKEVDLVVKMPYRGKLIEIRGKMLFDLKQ